MTDTSKESEGADSTTDKGPDEGPDVPPVEWFDDSTRRTAKTPKPAHPQQTEAARLYEEDQMRSLRAFEGDRDE